MAGGSNSSSAEPEDARASPQQTRQDRRRIRARREVRRKDKALAETAALLVLSKKVEAIFDQGEGRCTASKIAAVWPEQSTTPVPLARGWIVPARWPGLPPVRCSAGRSPKVWSPGIAGRLRGGRSRPAR